MASRGEIAIALRKLGQSKVDDNRVQLAIDQHVAGLQVAMQYAFVVRVMNGQAQPIHQPDCFLDAERLISHALEQRLPLDVGHRKVDQAADLTDFVDRYDVGMGQSGRCFGFAAKTF